MLPRAIAVLSALAVACRRRPGPASSSTRSCTTPPTTSTTCSSSSCTTPATRRSTSPAGSSPKGVKYTFPAGDDASRPDGYLVVCKNLEGVQEALRLRRGRPVRRARSATARASVELLDAGGKKVDGVKYGSRAPWPVGAGRLLVVAGAHLPDGAGDRPGELGAVAAAAGTPKPGGTPGKKNASYAAAPAAGHRQRHLHARRTPRRTRRSRSRPTSARPTELATVELRYRVAGSGYENEEKTVAHDEGRRRAATPRRIPGQKAGQIVRFRIRAADAKGGERFFPHPNELRPALSVYVHDKFEPGKVPFGLIINVGEAEFRAAQRGGGRGCGFGGPPPDAAGARQVGVRLRRSEDRRAASCSTSSASRRATAAARSTSTRTTRSTA